VTVTPSPSFCAIGCPAWSLSSDRGIRLPYDRGVVQFKRYVDEEIVGEVATAVAWRGLVAVLGSEAHVRDIVSAG